jgi:carbamoyl-phosphate synthase large subunit
VPFVSKATGLPLAKIAARCMAGKSLAAQGVAAEVVPTFYSVKEAVFPFIKFPGADTILGPEMKSTGEVMGVGKTFAEAFVKSQMASGERLPSSGKVFLSVRDSDKPRLIDIARSLHGLGFTLVATRGTAAAVAAAGLPVVPVNKVAEGRPHIVDMIKNREITLIVNTVEDRRAAIRDSYAIRRAALQQRVSLFTTLAGARAGCTGMEQVQELSAYRVQHLHGSLAAKTLS